MSAIAPRGWCPSLFAPMASGDGLLVRVKPPGGVLTSAQAHALAEAAARWGNGIVELGNRASVQLRGLTPDAIAPFTQAMLAVGLALPDPAAEARRSVVAPPLIGHDPALSPHAGPVAAALAERLTAAEDLSALPGKFGCLVDGGGALPLGGVPADVRVLLAGEACAVALDGAWLAARCAPDAAADAVARLLRAFLALADGARRMRGLVESVGAAAVFRAAGLSAEPILPLPAPAATVGWLAYEAAHAPAPLEGGGGGRGIPAANHVARDPSPDPPPSRGGGGWAAPATALQRRAGIMLAGLPFGAADAATLHALADLAPEGLLRVTPFRAFAVADLFDPAPLAALGLLTDPDDPRARIDACPGAPACGAASVPARADAAAIAALGLPGRIHVSGCAKGCAHPGPADLVLVGEGGHYALLRDGRAGDPPQVRGLSVAAVLDRLQRESPHP